MNTPVLSYLDLLISGQWLSYITAGDVFVNILFFSLLYLIARKWRVFLPIIIRAFVELQIEFFRPILEIEMRKSPPRGDRMISKEGYTLQVLV